MSRGWQEDIAWVAEPNPKPDDLLHWLDRVDARHDAPPSRLTVDTGRSNPLAISRIDEPEAIPLEMSSRSASVSVSQRAPASSRNYTAALRQQEPNRTMALTEGAANLMQRLARLPAAPHVDPLLRGEPVPFSLCHKHHL